MILETNNADLMLESHEQKKIFRFNLKGSVCNQEWVNLFESVFQDNVESNEFSFLIDNRFGDDEIDIHGFRMLGNLFQKYEIQNCSICIFTKDKGMEMLKDLFLVILKGMGLDFKCQVFFEEQDALNWLAR